MAYATADDFKTRLGEQVSDLVANRGEGEVDDTALSAALESAAGVIDAYVPGLTDPVSPLFVGMNIDIAAYQLAQGKARTKERIERYKDAIKILEALKPKDGTTAPGVSSGAAVRHGTAERLVSRTTTQDL